MLNSGPGCREAARPRGCNGVPCQVAGQQAAAGGLQELDPDEGAGFDTVSIEQQSSGPRTAVTSLLHHTADGCFKLDGA